MEPKLLRVWEAQDGTQKQPQFQWPSSKATAVFQMIQAERSNSGFGMAGVVIFEVNKLKTSDVHVHVLNIFIVFSGCITCGLRRVICGDFKEFLPFSSKSFGMAHSEVGDLDMSGGQLWPLQS